MKLALVSLGCHKNLVDSENLIGILSKRKDVEIISNIEEADVAIVNTCGFIGDAKEESIETIIEVGELKETGNLKKLIVAGCLAQRYSEDLMEELSEIDGIIGTGEIDKIEEVLDEVIDGKKIIKSESLDFLANSETERVITTMPHTAYIKIAEGCDNRCAFCIIPYLRGKYRSRTIEDIIKEIENLVSNGVREVNIIAQDTTEYGIDIYGKRRLADLLREIAKVEELERIRVFYTYPSNFDDELIKVIKEEDKICKYIDIPIQHVSDKILTSMRRRGTAKEMKELLYKIRREIPEAVFRTSLIVGFPGETEEEFEELKDFVEEFKFNYAGIFNFSREEDTPAFDLENQIDDDTRHKRWVELTNIQSKIAENINRKYIGEVVEVIIDGVSEESEYMLEGRTCGQAPEIDGKVLINDGTGERGEIVKVKIEQNFDYDLLGGIIENEFTK
ncbi:30S ribosomal protein S12 methylthiotransferase RimO [Haliovirga abyssi]|uniref:Ribosomal protein uS12 methylthiotransferase RimO n=1 Tax=Haliovirga abyssi TaxID=2996794 RepID=A0AAU9DSI5_9FUSO|nr:30S ribosomal protein S12 methylthiotransferase RimO [Haliovirga abyssi]BDU49989.1 ribosomal protein S12 methylthiotransferase RimO [Haliovirga abyssi]